MSRALGIVLAITLVAGCGGKPDGPSVVRASSSVQDGTGDTAPARLACPTSARDGEPCDSPMTCEDEVCGPFSCEGGTWHRLDGDGTCVSTPTAHDACPADPPKDCDWCSASATCNYPDTCSQRPAGTPTRTFYCNAYDWTIQSAPYAVACPDELPSSGDPCERACAYPTCKYGCTTASCDPKSGTWQQTPGACVPDGGA